MGNNVVCAKCDSLETAHAFPKLYPITRGHRYVPQKDLKRKKRKGRK